VKPAPSIAERLAPEPCLPWITLTQRLDRAREALAEIRELGYDIGVFPNGRDLYIRRPGKTLPPSRVHVLVNTHHNALVALIALPEACESVVGVIAPAAPPT
jgi:hypothetical protein